MGERPSCVLVVDDDAPVGRVLVALLEQVGHEAEHVASGPAALARLDARPFDLVLTDLMMPEMDGIALLREVGRRWPGVPVVLLTAHGSVPTAVEAMKAGAVDYILKPFDREELVYVVAKAVAGAAAQESAAAPVEGGQLLGESRAMRELMAVVKKAAAGQATVLLMGETGTGKELVARALHEASPRRGAPLVKVNCGALPEALLESELFGYEKGAFTGATTRKPGRVELAHKGTLFLDEIGDVSPAVQVKLLRVLQERELERVGGTQTIRVDVRFVAATHRDLEALVASGAFREDLFYRLNVVPIRLPPLREREGDVERLARRFCAEHSRANGRGSVTFDAAALELLDVQPWPGNVRQLQNFVERLVVLTDGTTIGRREVERELGAAAVPEMSSGSTLDAQRKATERDAIQNALLRAKDNRSLAARLLGVSRRTLYNKLRELDLDPSSQS